MDWLIIIIISTLVLLCIVVGGVLYRKFFMHIKHQEFYEDGSVKCEYFTVNGIKDGIESIYYPTKELNKTKTWSHGLLEGPFVVYFRNGERYIEGSYSNGDYKGVYCVYDLNGSILTKKEY